MNEAKLFSASEKNWSDKSRKTKLIYLSCLTFSRNKNWGFLYTPTSAQDQI